MSWWVDRQRRDKFVKQRDVMQYRSRAAFKLQELLDKAGLKKQQGPFVDLGAAPGGWSQVLREVYPHDKIFACDLLDMLPLQGVDFLKTDFLSDEFAQYLKEKNISTVGGIFSDIAPNLSGQSVVQQAQMADISDKIQQFSKQFLHPKGFIVQKLFHGECFDSILSSWKESYAQVRVIKPAASRAESREIYIIIQKKYP
jgi:23S rRNA (uridine2552-2'-O)-methyltransferase